jgi:hypothetical protein
MRVCGRCAGGRRRWGQILVHGCGRSLDEVLVFCFVCSVFEPMMESDRWPLYRGGDRNGPVATDIGSM